MKRFAIVTALVLSSSLALAARPRPGAPGNPGDGGGLNPHPIASISGSVQFIGCRPALNQVRVKLMPGNKTVSPSTQIHSNNGVVSMSYRFQGGLNENLTYTVSTQVPPGCSGAQMNRSSSPAEVGQSTAAFVVKMPSRETVVELRSAVDVMNLFLGAMELKLHNYKSNTSYLKIGGQSVSLPLPPRRMDLDCGTFCPDLGDAIFYVNDIRLSDANMSLTGSQLKLAMLFEDQGREVKGLHNSLGDSEVPDFELQRMSLETRPVLNVRDDGRLDLQFTNTVFRANVSSTGGCGLAGLDICDFFFGTDGKIKKGIQEGASMALNSAMVRNKIATSLSDLLRLRGITTPIIYYKIEGSRLIISSRS